MHASQLAVLPNSDTQEKTHNIAQLFTIQLLNISVSAHLGEPVADLATKSIQIDQKSHHRSGHRKGSPFPNDMPYGNILESRLSVRIIIKIDVKIRTMFNKDTKTIRKSEIINIKTVIN